jgi:hypothetical protein
MAQEKFKRKLTTIFSADVAGYSRLMGEDEAATVKTLKQYKGIMSELIHQHRGRVVDSPPRGQSSIRVHECCGCSSVHGGNTKGVAVPQR